MEKIKNKIMKILKSIMYVYLGIIGCIGAVVLITFPFILSEYFEYKNYLLLFFINLPIILGFMFIYLEPEFNHSSRPRR